MLKTWVPLAISLLALFVSSLTLLLDWRKFDSSREALSITRTLSTPEMYLKLDEHGRTISLVSRIELRLVNHSTQSASISEITCDSGPHDPEFNMTSGYTLFANSCRIIASQDGAEYEASGPINVNENSSVGIFALADYPAPPKIEAALRDFISYNDFNDEDFLLYLAENQTDFFETEFPLPYSYLQRTFGKNFCLGGSVYVNAISHLGTRIHWHTDFYLGPALAVVACDKGNSMIEINGSEPYRTDFWFGQGELDEYFLNQMQSE